MPTDEPSSRDNALNRARSFERQREAEAIKAKELIRGFIVEAAERGVEPRPLTARGYSGRWRYKTSLTGWYLKRDRTLAVGTDGEYYILSVPDGIAARFKGATVDPAQAVMEIGRGGRDGESLPLADALERRLNLGNEDF